MAAMPRLNTLIRALENGETPVTVFAPPTVVSASKGNERGHGKFCWWRDSVRVKGTGTPNCHLHDALFLADAGEASRQDIDDDNQRADHQVWPLFP